MRFAGICIAILGAAIGKAHPGTARSITWTVTALLASALVIVGEFGVLRWRAQFAADASPQEAQQRLQLQKFNRLQLRLLTACIAAFIGVLLIPVSPAARMGIWLTLLVCIAVGNQLIGYYRNNLR